jgi:fatty acid desaturase
MRTHLEVLAEIPAARRAALHLRSDWLGLRHLAGHLAALLICSLWIALAAPYWGIVQLPQGLVLVFLFTLQHECTHETPFASVQLSRVAGHVIGFLLCNPFIWFRYFHLAHHRHTNDPARDPELLSGCKPETWAGFLWHVSGLPLWAGMFKLVLRNAWQPEAQVYLPARAMGRMQREARVILLGYAVVLTSLLWSDLALWLWLIPALIGQPFLRIYLLAEHGRCAAVANMLENTRTTYTVRLVRWLAWNMPYHIEHHSVPAVPFHKLPQLHELMRDDLGVVSEGYAAFTKAYAAQLK